jgi:AcrR family transcriptional regulator
MPSLSTNSERADKILLAATQLFARQGYSGTSTREIARLADVSENTLFRHFEHKEDLFWATLRSHSAWLTFCKDSLEGITAFDAPEVVLPKILGLLTDTADFRPELLRLIAVAFLELQWKAEAFCQEQLEPIFSIIRKYLAINIKSGRMHNFDPTMVTAALMTTVLMHSGMARLIDGNTPTYSDSRDAARAYTRFWLDVLSPRLEARPWPISSMAGQPSS